MLKPLSRRTVIRGAAGAVIALPMLEAMRPRHAKAQGAVPKRLILWYTAGGQMPAYWYPMGTETTFTLNTAHKPLEAYKNKLIIFDGVNADASKEPIYGGHQGSFAAMISGMPHTGVGFDVMRPTGPSIDQIVADKIGASNRIKSLQTGVQNPGTGGNNPFVRMGSWRGEKELLPAISQPSALFDYLFANGVMPGAAPNPMAGDALRKRRKSILDAVSGRFTALKARVGTEDKLRLDRHMTSIREIEDQVLKVQPQGACMIPARPGAEVLTTRTSDVPMWGKLNMDLMVLALACDVTRVANWMWGGMGGAGTATWLGHTNDHHNLAHGNALKEMTEWNTWYSTQLAYLMGALEKYPDVGGGTLLDNTLIMWWNELGNGSAHLSNRAPFVLAGGAGGALKMGRFLNYTPAIQNNQILLTVYNVLTDSQDKVFGSPKYCPGPAPGLV